jgi:hypothetical protein
MAFPYTGPYFPEHPYKPGQPPWCPFNFYRTSVDVEVLYASIFAINLPSTVEFLRAKLSFPGCWAYPDMCVSARANSTPHNPNAHPAKTG